MTLDKFPSFLAALTFVAITIVVSHEWGYFGVVGSDFQSLYTTYDYVSQLITWIGPVFIFMAVAIGFDLFVRRIGDFEFTQQAKSKWGKFIENYFAEIFYGVLAPFVFLFTNQTERLFFYILLALIYARLIGYVLSYNGFAEFRKSFACALAYVPAAMILFYGVGHDLAYRDMKDTKDRYELQLKEQHVVRDVKVLRLLEKGAIIFDPATKLVEFYRQENIASLRKNSPDWDTKSFACRNWNWGCDPKSLERLLFAPRANP